MPTGVLVDVPPPVIAQLIALLDEQRVISYKVLLISPSLSI